MPKLYGYIRVSSIGQVERGTSLETQQVKIREEFDRNWANDGFEFGGIQGDPAVSGKVPFLERAGGQKVVYAAEKGDVIIFCHLDRAFRSTKDALATIETIVKLGVRPIFLDLKLDLGTPIGKFVFTNLAAFAELERSIMNARIAEGRAAHKKKGLPMKSWFGTKLVGPHKGKRLHVVEDDYAFGLQLLSWHNKGYSYEQIAQHLNDCGLRIKLNPDGPVGKDYKHLKVKPIERLYDVRNVTKRILGTIKTTQWIRDGKAARISKLPAGVARTLTSGCPTPEAMKRVLSGEPHAPDGPRIVYAEEIPDGE